MHLARNCEGTEQLRIFYDYDPKVLLTLFSVTKKVTYAWQRKKQNIVFGHSASGISSYCMVYLYLAAPAADFP